MSLVALAVLSVFGQDVSVPDISPNDTPPRRLSGGRLQMPDEALEHTVSGRAVLDCLLPPVGPVQQCRVVEELPAGWGFGDAALAGAPTVRMAPAVRDGQPVEARVRLPFNFTAIGTVRLSCEQGATGAGPDCVAIEESPPGRGLGAIAVAEMATRRREDFGQVNWKNGRFEWLTDVPAPFEPCVSAGGRPACEQQ